MPLYYVLYCGVGVNYRRLMPGKKFLGESEAKLGQPESSSTTVGYVNRFCNKDLETPNISAEYLDKFLSSSTLQLRISGY